MAKDFRNAVCEFLGFNMKSTKDGTFRLQSIYSGPDDFFLFTVRQLFRKEGKIRCQKKYCQKNNFTSWVFGKK